tara:strand:- start:85 stop:378 length:294 start_codon:yes stop_codon:yes gene_type:complete
MQNKFYLKHTKNMIKNSKLQFTISTKNLIKYGYGLQDNIITLTVPTVNPNIEVKLRVEIESINTFKIKNMFVSNIISDKENLLQFSNKIKTALNKGV